MEPLGGYRLGLRSSSLHVAMIGVSIKVSAQITETMTFTQIIAILTSWEYPETPP